MKFKPLKYYTLAIKRREKSNEDKLSDTIGSFVNQDRIKPKFHQVGINIVWKELMGEIVDRYTTSITVSNHKLILVISSGPLKHELAYNKENLINLINDKMGDDYIKEIIIR